MNEDADLCLIVPTGQRSTVDGSPVRRIFPILSAVVVVGRIFPILSAVVVGRIFSILSVGTDGQNTDSEDGNDGTQQARNHYRLSS